MGIPPIFSFSGNMMHHLQKTWASPRIAVDEQFSNKFSELRTATRVSFSGLQRIPRRKQFVCVGMYQRRQKGLPTSLQA
jgi:hypothetical protein